MSAIEAPTVTLTNRLRAVAEFIDFYEWPADAHIIVGSTSLIQASVRVTIGTYDADTFRTVRRLIGPMEKTDGETHGPLVLTATFPSFVVVVVPPEGTCRQVETGEVETVEVERVVTPAVVEKVVETRPVLEWDCGPVLADATSGDVA